MTDSETVTARIEELERSDAHRRALNRLVSRLTQATDVAGLWEALREESIHFLQWDGLCLAIRGQEADDLEVLESSVIIDGKPRPFPREHRHLSVQPTAMLRVFEGESVLCREPFVVKTGAPTSFEKICLPLGHHIWVPLRRGEAVIGFLSAHLREPAQWDERDLAQMELLANTITPALMQAIIEHQLHVITEPHHVTLAGAMSSPEGKSLGNLIGWLYREIRRYLGFHRASLFLYDEETDALVSDDLLGFEHRGDLNQSAPQPVGFSISGKCFSEGRPIVIHDCSKTDLIPREYVESLSLKSSIAVPVSVGGRVIGVLRIDDTEKTHRFTDEDVEFFSMLGMMMGIMALSPQLFREAREAEQAMRERERSFRSLAENSSDGILITIGGKRVVYANGRALQITGRSRADLMQRTLDEWAPSTVREEMRRAMEKPEGNEVTRSPLRDALLTQPRGREMPIEVSATRMVWKGESAVMVILRDVTERKELERQVLEISESEQRRFGYDLHDGLSQTIAAIAIRSRALERQLSAFSPEGSAAAAAIVSMAKHASNEAHFLARGLSPVHLDSRGLVHALRDLAEDLSNTYEMECRVEADSAIEIADGATASQLYRIAQEAANNSARHGRPQRILISMTRRLGEIILAIEDDGEGFTDSQRMERGLGLKIMEHRASTIGARLTIGDSEAGGVLVVCSMKDQGGDQ